MSSTSHTSKITTRQETGLPQVTVPVHGRGFRSTDGDLELRPGTCFISKVKINGNVFYSAAPTTLVSLWYADDEEGETLLYPDLNISTVNVTIGATLHMKTILGQDLKVNGAQNGRLIARMIATNTTVELEIWGYRYK